MTRRNDNKSTYRHETARAVYLVTLDRLKNDRNGNPRFSANIITTEIKGGTINGNYYTTANYNFTGHYCGDMGEVEYIVNRYEQDIA